uniref:Uncharacterized protein n=1 Tax=Anguilla anguilla TaxID=7936 RepID=A0A0E9TNK6_ANGAN
MMGLGPHGDELKFTPPGANGQDCALFLKNTSWFLLRDVAH